MDGHFLLIWIFAIFHTGNGNKCYKRLTSDSGTILSPNYPDKYGGSLNCVWDIHLQRGNRIVLYFHEFQLYSGVFGSDELAIYEGEINDENILVHKTGKDSLYHKTVISTTERISLVFESCLLPVGRRGFNITWEVCGGTFIGHEGFLTSPRLQYTFYSPGHYQCLFNLQIPETGSAVQVDVSATEFNNDKCLLQISELRNTIIRDICSATDPRIYVSYTNEVTLKFELEEGSDVALNASFTKYDCSRIIRNTSSGLVQSPNYSDYFDRDSVCDYAMNFSLPDHQLIKLIINKIAFSCNGSDLLEILNHDVGNNINVSRQCNDNETDILYIRDNSVIRFISKYDGHAVIFSISYSIVDIPLTTVSTSMSDSEVSSVSSVSSDPSVSLFRTMTEQVIIPHSESLVPGIIGGVACVVVVVVSIVIVFILYRHRRNQSGKPQNTTVKNAAVNFTAGNADIGESRITFDQEEASFPTYSNIAPTKEQLPGSGGDGIYKDTEEDEYDVLRTSRQKVSPGKGDNLYDVSVRGDDQYDTTRHFASSNKEDDHYMYDSAKQVRDEDNAYDMACNSA